MQRVENRIELRRLVLLSALLIFAGLLLLLPSSDFWSLLTTGSTTSSVFASLTSTDDTAAIGSVLGFGAILVGLVLEVLSLFTDVGPPAQIRMVPVSRQEEKKQ